MVSDGRDSVRLKRSDGKLGKDFVLAHVIDAGTQKTAAQVLVLVLNI